MTRLALRTAGLGKRYVIGADRGRFPTLRDTLVNAAKRPIERIRHPGAATHKSETLWALKDVDLEVREGEVVGIVGANGSGKSTLLKILSRITEQTEGRVEVRGRVASLLEVGTGFHPELTGRENVQLNGAILGMSRAEIKSKFDDIVEFSEIGRFLDTPVKRYSSGMYVRLAFAVAAHMESDIIAVDEVLAVGDAAFQEKCLGKMSDISHGGRTVLFVSHNLAAVKMLCDRAVLLDGGRVKKVGATTEVLETYMARGADEGGERRWASKEVAPHGSNVWLKAARVVQEGACRSDVDIDKPVHVEMDIANESEGMRLFVNLFVVDALGSVVLETLNTPEASLRPSAWYCEPHPRGTYRYTCTLPSNFLNDGRYSISMLVGSPNPATAEMRADQIVTFNVIDTGAMRSPGLMGPWQGVVRVPLEWHGELIEQKL